MKRRRFLAALGGAALARPIVTVAQQPVGVPRIGLLMGSSPSVEAPALRAFREALVRLGYVDGETIVLEVRYAEGQRDRLGGLARELVALAPSVITCVGKFETAALQAATRSIPIVFMQAPDPVEQGLIASLARPGGSTTGFSQMAGELDSKRLQLLHDIAPSLSRAAFLVNPNFPLGLLERVARAEIAGKSLGITLRRFDAGTPAELIAALAANHRSTGGCEAGHTCRKIDSGRRLSSASNLSILVSSLSARNSHSSRQSRIDKVSVRQANPNATGIEFSLNARRTFMVTNSHRSLSPNNLGYTSALGSFPVWRIYILYIIASLYKRVHQTEGRQFVSQ